MLLFPTYTAKISQQIRIGLKVFLWQFKKKIIKKKESLRLFNYKIRNIMISHILKKIKEYFEKKNLWNLRVDKTFVVI